jgi:hypothetical protein
MKRLSKILVFGIALLMCFSWIINGRGVYSAPASEVFKQKNTRNLYYSKWVPVNQWISTSALGRPARAYEINPENLNLENLDEGKLLVYTRIKSDDVPALLPTTKRTANNESRLDYVMTPSGMLRIVSINISGEFTPVESPDMFQYLYIPKNLLNQLNIDINDYEAVKNALALPE